METTALNRKLIAAGLNSQQIESKTAKVVVDVLAEDQGLLLAEVKAQVAQAKNAAESAKYRVGELYQRHTEAIEHADRLIEHWLRKMTLAQNYQPMLQKIRLSFLHLC